MANQVPPVSEQDVESLKEKLRTFIAALTPEEQLLLGVLLSRPVEATEVEAYTGLLLPSNVLGSLAQSFSAPTAKTNFVGVLDAYRPR